ncbi:MAG: thiamine-phosphate kinase [Salinarimonadaceae bacterium]|nr:MAG: thiamine-phosphate kinase [Salinarimonadaceae bacterium]
MADRTRGEDAIIADYFAPVAGEGGFGLRDDAAAFSPAEGCDVVVTADALVSGVHFFPDDPPAAIARKALAVNLSDLAAKGANPRGFVISLALEDDWREEWLAEFAGGLGYAARIYGCPLMGGDTVRAAGPFWVSITAFGEVPKGRMVHRFSALAGDIVCVSGTIGDAALGLKLRGGATAPWTMKVGLEQRVVLTDRFVHPQPRLALAPILRERVRAAMDVSDGLAGDLAKMCRLSGVGADVDLSLVPVSVAADAARRLHPPLFDVMMTGGDDYEILCATPPENLDALLADCETIGLRMTPIGHFRQGECTAIFRDDDVEKRYEKASFSHF